MAKVNKREEQALHDKDIKIGDVVSTPFRGGHREGHVTKIARTPAEHPHPPKVLFYDEAKKREFAHNPGTLTKISGAGDAEEEGEEGDEEEEDA